MKNIFSKQKNVNKPIHGFLNSMRENSEKAQLEKDRMRSERLKVIEETDKINANMKLNQVKPKKADEKTKQPTAGGKQSPEMKSEVQTIGPNGAEFISQETIDLYKVVSNQKPEAKEGIQDSLINNSNTNEFFGPENLKLLHSVTRFKKPLNSKKCRIQQKLNTK